MKRTWPLLLLCVTGLGCAPPVETSGTLYQVSTLPALQEGCFEGVVTLAELRRHGDFGIGTFEGLDGEMILLDGVIYQARADGRICRPPPTATTPFANMTFYQPEKSLNLTGTLDLPALLRALDEAADSKNLFYAARIEGEFTRVRTRVVPEQKPPYPTLLATAQQQVVSDWRDVRGTLVALRCPDYARQTNLAGWHLHFLSDDRTKGGHVLAVQGRNLRATMQTLTTYKVLLPTAGRFLRADLAAEHEQAIRKAEK